MLAADRDVLPEPIVKKLKNSPGSLELWLLAAPEPPFSSGSVDKIISGMLDAGFFLDSLSIMPVNSKSMLE